MKTTRSFKVTFEVKFKTDDSWEEDELQQLSEEFISYELPIGWSDNEIELEINNVNSEMFLEEDEEDGKTTSS